MKPRRTNTETPARRPDRHGYVERDGVRIHWEIYGSEGPTILLMPTWAVNHSRPWKAQIGYLARHFRIVTFDGRGNGLSDRPAVAAAYHAREYVADSIAVLDAVRAEGVCGAGLSLGGIRALLLAAAEPARVNGLFLIDATVPHLTPGPRDRAATNFDAKLANYRGWQKYNRHYWLRDYREFLEFFFA